jgi:hypothetical protein
MIHYPIQSNPSLSFLLESSNWTTDRKPPDVHNMVHYNYSHLPIRAHLHLDLDRHMTEVLADSNSVDWVQQSMDLVLVLSVVVAVVGFVNMGIDDVVSFA